MKKTSEDSTLRVTKKNKESLYLLCEKEGLSVKDCLSFMTDFFLKSKISVKEDFVSADKVGERIIKIIRTQEKLYLEPLLQKIKQVEVFQNNLVADSEFFQEEENSLNEITSSEVADEVPKMSVTSPIRTVDNSEESFHKIETLTMKNGVLIEKLNEFINPNNLTKKQGIGEVHYLLKLSEEQISEVRKTITRCTIQ